MIGELLNSPINSRGRRCRWRGQFPTVSEQSQPSLQRCPDVTQVAKLILGFAPSDKRLDRFLTNCHGLLARMAQPGVITSDDRGILLTGTGRESLGSEMRNEVINGLLA